MIATRLASLAQYRSTAPAGMTISGFFFAGADTGAGVVFLTGDAMTGWRLSLGLS
jgi:hypothetical protein